MCNHSDFKDRHIGVSKKELSNLLKTCNINSLDSLIQETVPIGIQLKSELSLPKAKNESELLEHLRTIAKKNTVTKSYIGLGYHNCHTPTVILRNIFENPGWYTQYTPYQAEISQGRLELLFHFQTMICELTGMDIANASLLDEATAAAEAMMAIYRNRSKEQVKENCNTFLIHQNLHPQTINVMKTRATPLGIQLKECKIDEGSINNSTFGLMLQYPDTNGLITNHTELIQYAKSKNVQIAVASDPLSLTLLTPPGEWGADIVIGSTQRFGVPLGFGGPHAAYIASKESLTRQLPGRIIGLSKDRHNNEAYRMALQTREQHIRKEKATSNICTAQALLAIMAGTYSIYHGPKGLKQISTTIHELTKTLFIGLSKHGFKVVNHHFFDTLHIETDDLTDTILKNAEKQQINFRKTDKTHIGISLDETTKNRDIELILSIFKTYSKTSIQVNEGIGIPSKLQRNTRFLTQTIFNTHHSETQLMRYLKNLENKDLSLTKSMIPLGSCTMKLNAATEMMPLSWPEFSSIHPYVPLEQAKGYLQIITELEKMLATITGLYATSLQPNSGAQGEYAGLLVIKSYFESKDQKNRNLILIPKSAHGTNPASAQMAGFEIKWINCDDSGNIDINDLKTKSEKHEKNLAGLMITYPSTHGVFEESIQTICKTIHDNGGQVYMDGANMNAQVGLTHPGIIGADVCHLNLHKTFSIPHGGGGPGMGPICVAKHLAPYLPQSPIESPDNTKAGAISATPWSSASILLISYAYILMMGTTGLTEASKVAILNANYIASRLKEKFTILFTGKKERVAHELIIDCREFKKTAGITVEDIAKRLIDYGFHAPTMSWPVPDTLMIEPTESEDKEEIDRFCNAMLSIYNEIFEVESGKEDKINNVLKNAPHTCKELCSNDWLYPYSREKAAVNANDPTKFWASIGRIDNAYGDRNLVCSCPPIEDFQDN